MNKIFLLVCALIWMQPGPLLAQDKQVELRLIVVRTEAEAADVVSRLRAGGAFDALARARSMDPTSRGGGDLGTIPLRDLRTEFQNALQGLVPGQVSPTFRLGANFALLQLVAEKGGDGKALQDAVSAKDIARVKALLAAGADANLALDDGYTILMDAAREGSNEMVQALIAAGAKPAASARNGATALLEAAFAGHADVVPLLLAAGANPNARLNDGSTILMKAALNDKPDIVQALLAAGADVNARTPDGLTALMQAAFAGQTAVVRVLLDAKANVNARLGDGSTALMAASLGGRVEIVRALLDARADARLGSNNGATALMEAANAGHADVVRLLLNAGSDINASLTNGMNALMGAALGGHTEILRTLIAAGANLNARDTKGRTALTHAAASSNSATVLALVDAGVEVPEVERRILVGGTYVNEYYASRETRLLDLATTEFQKVLSAQANNLPALEWTAAIEVLRWNGTPTLEQFQRANALLKRALALAPTDPEREYWIAATDWAFVEQGKGMSASESAAILSDGIDHAKKALAASPRYWEAMACLSGLYRLSGERVSADTMSRQAVQIRDGNQNRPTRPTDQFSTPAIPPPPTLP